MKPDNDWYGHKRILADYCGLKSPRPIFGYVPHGWYFDVPEAAGERRFKSAPYLVWNERHAEQVSAAGVPNVRIIGAPFSYLFEMMFGGDTPAGKGTILFPSHSADAIEVRNSATELAASVMEDFPSPYTVSIFYQDLGKPEVETYRQLGWRIVSFGSRSDPMFLYRQLVELAAHSTVVGNCPQTALWYGALLSRHVAIIGPRPKRNAVSPLHDESNMSSLLEQQFNRVESVYPELMRQGLVGEAAFEAGAIELGFTVRLSPESLMTALGWSLRSKTTAAMMIGRLNDFRLGKNVRLGNLR